MSEDSNALNEELSGDNENNENVDNGGVGPGDAEEQGVNDTDQTFAAEDDPKSVKKRLGMQAKKHQREIRALHERLSQMQSHMEASQNQREPMHSPGQPDPAGMNEEAKIEHAVRKALGYQEEQRRQAEEGQRAAHVHKQYQRLNDEFDKASDKYEDFDEVVRGDDVPFTPHVRDALLLLENAPDVAYKLGKSRSELERISKLHPLDQAREVNKLSFSLMGGNSNKSGSSSRTTPLGNVRANPAGASHAVTDKTPTSEIRRRMKSGDWK